MKRRFRKFENTKTAREQWFDLENETQFMAFTLYVKPSGRNMRTYFVTFEVVRRHLQGLI